MSIPSKRKIELGQIHLRVERLEELLSHIINSFEVINRELFYARVATEVLKEKGLITDEDIAQAIKKHTPESLIQSTNAGTTKDSG